METQCTLKAGQHIPCYVEGKMIIFIIKNLQIVQNLPKKIILESNINPGTLRQQTGNNYEVESIIAKMREALGTNLVAISDLESVKKIEITSLTTTFTVTHI